MSVTWLGPEPPIWQPLTPFEWVRFGLRACLWALATTVLTSLFFVTRGVDGLLGTKFARHVVWAWSRMSMVLAGLSLDRRGRPMTHPGAIVANHGSWLDIFVVRAAAPVYFVAKAEVRTWPVIGWLARITDTLFIERTRTATQKNADMLRDRLDRGQALCFFPEGTSSDALRVLPFKSTLFSVFMSEGVKDQMWVQPVTVIYRAPENRPANFYGWWSDMPFAGHVVQVFGKSSRGGATVVFHDPVRASDFADRKALSAHAGDAVRLEMEREMADRGIVPPPERAREA